MGIREIAELVNLEPSDDLFCEIFPIDENNSIIRYANKTDATCIYIKVERFEVISGGIIMWHGLLADIPPDYALCDGNYGTPDLRDKFVVGAADAVDPGGEGGAVSHSHDFTGDGHSHWLQVNGVAQSGLGISGATSAASATGTTDPEDHLPPYYEIAFIMKL